MNFSLPIICTKHIGTAYDLVKDGVNGYLEEPGDILDIANKIDYLSKNRKTAIKMGQMSAKIVKKWNFKKDARCIEKTVSSVVRD
jgi:glycosyltransferase involved in cell wall biosynthesis